MTKYKPIGIPTTNGIILGVDLENGQLAFSSTGLSGFIPITNSNSSNIIKVDDLPGIAEAIKNSIYILGNSAVYFFDGTEFISLSLEAVENFNTPNQTTIPTTQAVSDFVNEKISEIDIPSSVNLSNYYNKSESDSKFATKDEIPDTSTFITKEVNDLTNYYNKTDSDGKFATKDEIIEEVIYVDEFPSAGIKDTIYISKTGEAKIWDGSEFIPLSHEILTIIENNPLNNIAVPTVQAVIDYVSGVTPTLPENITTQGNEFNTGNQLVQLVNGKIPENLYDGDTQNIFYIDEFPSSGVANSIYIKKETSETKFYTGTEFIAISLEAINDLAQASDNTVATSKSIIDYLSAYYADKAYVTEAVTSAMLSGEVDLTSYAKTEWVNTELAKKANTADLNNYYNKSESDSKFATKDEIPDTSTFITKEVNNLTNYYNKTDSDGKFALKTDLPEKEEVIYVDEFPSAGISGVIYVNSNGQSKIWDGSKYINMSFEVVEDFSTINNDIVPSVQAVSSFIDEKISEIDIPSSVDLSNYYNKSESDEKFALKENTVSYTFTTENSLNTIPITNGQAVICEDSEKLYIDKTDTRISIGDLIIVEASTDLPETPLNKLYFVKETDKLYIYSNNTWVSINPNQFIDPNRLLPSTAENGNLLQYYIETGDLVTPTGLNETSQQDGEDWTISFENFWDLAAGSYWYALFDGDTQYNNLSKHSAYNIPMSIQWKSNKEKKILNKLRIYPALHETSGEYYPYFAPATFKLSGSNDGQVWTTLLTVDNYLWPGDNGYYFTYSDIYHDWFFENNNGYLYYKLEVTDAVATGAAGRGSVYFSEIQGYGEARGWRLISVDDIKSDIALDLSNYQQENNISIASTNGSISLSGTGFVINGNTSNTSGGLAIVEESGKLPSSIIPAVDLSNYYNKTESDEKFALKDDVNSKLALSVVEDFPTSGINNTLYVNNENHAQIYTNNQWKDIAIEVVENLDNPNQTTVPTTQAVSSFVDTKISEIDIPSTDLSNYYNKQESDGKFALKAEIPETSSFITKDVNNLTNYYTKTNSDGKFALKTEIPETSSFITKDVNNLTNYYTKTNSDNKYALKTEINNPEQKTEVTTNAITFKKDISIYKIEISRSTTFTFNFSQLDENNCYTFELWVSMSTPITLTFPSNVAWLNDEVPDMSEASTYCIVVRKLPATMGTSTITSPKALLNLAYQYALTLG